MDRLAHAAQVRDTSYNTVALCSIKTNNNYCALVCVWQKLELSRPTDVAHRTLHRLDRVSMKRGIFEKESQAAAATSPRPSRHVNTTFQLATSIIEPAYAVASNYDTTIFLQEFKNFSSGVSDRINRWVSKAKDQSVTSHGAAVRLQLSLWNARGRRSYTYSHKTAGV